jgi:hypothetical protein
MRVDGDVAIVMVCRARARARLRRAGYSGLPRLTATTPRTLAICCGLDRGARVRRHASCSTTPTRHLSPRVQVSTSRSATHCQCAAWAVDQPRGRRNAVTRIVAPGPRLGEGHALRSTTRAPSAPPPVPLSTRARAANRRGRFCECREGAVRAASRSARTARTILIWCDDVISRPGSSAAVTPGWRILGLAAARDREQHRDGRGRRSHVRWRARRRSRRRRTLSARRGPPRCWCTASHCPPGVVFIERYHRSARYITSATVRRSGFARRLGFEYRTVDEAV